MLLLLAASREGRSESFCQTIRTFGAEGRCFSGLVPDTNGWMFGAVFPDSGAGSVFKMDSSGGNYTLLHTFLASPSDGAQTYARLIVVGDFLFGTSYLGGSGGFGTVFRLKTDGTVYQVLHHFGSIPSDGQYPYAEVASGPGGWLYGTTIGGGVNNRGTVYRLQQDGTGFQILQHFGGASTNAATPYSGITIGSNGVLFGTTFSGGRGSGTVYRMNSDGSNYQIIHRFGIGGDGIYSHSGLTLDRDGFLFGTTPFGGLNGQGIVFKMSQDGSGYTNLVSFGATDDDGRQGYQGLTLGQGGVLYGVTRVGGTNNFGTMFRMHTDGSGYQTLCHFATNETTAADLFYSPEGELYGSLTYSQRPEPGALFKFTFPVLLAFGPSEQGFHLQLSGAPGANYTVETTQDLVTWVPWLSTNLVTSHLDLFDATSPPGYRFYRAR